MLTTEIKPTIQQDQGELHRGRTTTNPTQDWEEEK
jgi:hypothetical protein